jgi:endonuclease III
MGRTSLTLRRAVALLRGHYGAPTPPPAADPFELVLWENVAYLARPARRHEAFALLRRAVGTRPAAILAASSRALEEVTGKGILKETFAGKLRQCARIAVERHGGDLAAAIRRQPAGARKMLQCYPGIGLPGAEKILLFSGGEASLAPDSNALRVLVRLGLVADDKSYARLYAAAAAAAGDLPREVGAMQEAHLLLQHHGRTLCKRSRPLCPACPLAPRCAWAREELRSA